MKDIDTKGSKAVGVWISPEFFEGLMRTGRIVEQCIEGIPMDLHLRSYGYDVKSNRFYMHFTTDDCSEGADVIWVAPVFGSI